MIKWGISKMVHGAILEKLPIFRYDSNFSRTRTGDLWVISQTLYPLGHGGRRIVLEKNLEL